MQRKLDAPVLSPPSYGLTLSNKHHTIPSGFVSRLGPSGRATSPSAHDLASSGPQHVFAGLRPRPRPVPSKSGQAPSWLPPGASLSKASAAHRAHRAASAPYQRQRQSTEPRNDVSPSECTLRLRPTHSPIRWPSPPSENTRNMNTAYSNSCDQLTATQEAPQCLPSQSHIKPSWSQSTYADAHQVLLHSLKPDIQPNAAGPSNGAGAPRPALGVITNTIPHTSSVGNTKGPCASGPRVALDSNNHKRLGQLIHNAAALEGRTSPSTGPLLPQVNRRQSAVLEQHHEHHQQQQMQHQKQRYEDCCGPAAMTPQTTATTQQQVQQQQGWFRPGHPTRQKQQQPEPGPPCLAPWLLTDSYDPAATATSTAATRASAAAANGGVSLSSSYISGNLPSPVNALLASLGMSQGANRLVPEKRQRYMGLVDALPASGQGGVPVVGMQTPAVADVGAAQARPKPLHLNSSVVMPMALQQVPGDASPPGTYNQTYKHDYQQQQQQQQQQRQEQYQRFPDGGVHAAAQLAGQVDGGTNLRPNGSSSLNHRLAAVKGAAERRMLQPPPETARQQQHHLTAASSLVSPSSWAIPVLLHGGLNVPTAALAPALSPRGMGVGAKVCLRAPPTHTAAAAASSQQRASYCDMPTQAAPVGNTTAPLPFGIIRDRYKSMQHHVQALLGHSQEEQNQQNQKNDFHHLYFQRQRGFHQSDCSPKVWQSAHDSWTYPFTMAPRSPPPHHHQDAKATADGGEVRSSTRPWSSPSSRGLIPQRTCVSAAAVASTSGRQPAGSPPIPVEWLEGVEELLLMLTPRSSVDADPRFEQRFGPDKAAAAGNGAVRLSPRARPLSSPTSSPQRMMIMTSTAQECWTSQQLCNQQRTLSQTQHHSNEVRKQRQLQNCPREAAVGIQDRRGQGVGTRHSSQPIAQRGKQDSSQALQQQQQQHGDEPLERGQGRDRVRAAGSEQTKNLRALSPGQTQLSQQRSQRMQGQWTGNQVSPSTEGGASVGWLFRRTTHMAVDALPNGGAGDNTSSVLPWTPPGVAPLAKRRMMHLQEETQAVKPEKAPWQLLPGQGQLGTGGPSRGHSQKHSNTRNSGIAKQHPHLQQQQQQKQQAQERSPGSGNVQYSTFDAAASAIAGRLLREAEEIGLAAAPRQSGECGMFVGVESAVGGSCDGRGRAAGLQLGQRQRTVLWSQQPGADVGGGVADGDVGITPAAHQFPESDWSPAVGGAGGAMACCAMPDASPRLEAVDEFLGRCAGDAGPRSQTLGSSPHAEHIAGIFAPRDLAAAFQGSSARTESRWHSPGLNSGGSIPQPRYHWTEWLTAGKNQQQQLEQQEQLLKRRSGVPPPALLLYLARRAFAGWRRQVVLRQLCFRMARERSQRLKAGVLRSWEEVVRVQQAQRQGTWATLTSLRLLRLLRKSWLAWRHAHVAGLDAAHLAKAQYARSLVVRATRGWITHWAQGASVRVLRRHRDVATLRACLAGWRELTFQARLEAAEEPQQLEYGRGVHRALRLRNCFRAWLLLTDAAMQVMSQQQVLRHVMHDELLNDAALCAAADAIARHRYLAPAFHAWWALAAATASAATATTALLPLSSTEILTTVGELHPWINPATASGGQPQMQPLPPMIYTGLRTEPAVTAPPQSPLQRPPSTQRGIVPWVPAETIINMDPGFVPRSRETRVVAGGASATAGMEQLADRRCANVSSSSSNWNNGQVSRNSSDSSGRSFEFNSPILQYQQQQQQQQKPEVPAAAAAAAVRLHNVEVTPQVERLRAASPVRKSWPSYAMAEEASSSGGRATAGSASLLDMDRSSLRDPQDLTQFNVPDVQDVGQLYNAEMGSKAHGSECVGTACPPAAGGHLAASIDSAATLTTPEVTLISDASYSPECSQRRSAGGSGVSVSMNTPPSVHAARLVQRHSSCGGGTFHHLKSNSGDDGSGNSSGSSSDRGRSGGDGGGGSVADGPSADELADGRSVLEELAPDVLFELLESDLAWYKEQYLTPPTEKRSRSVTRCSGNSSTMVAAAAAPVRGATETPGETRTATRTVVAASTVSLQSRPTALMGNTHMCTEKVAGPSPVAATQYPAEAPPRAAGPLAIPARVGTGKLSEPFDTGKIQPGPMSRDSSGRGADDGGSAVDSTEQSCCAADSECTWNPSRLFEDGKPSQELRVFPSNSSMEDVHLDAQPPSPLLPAQQQQQRQQPPPQNMAASSSCMAAQGAPGALPRGDSKLSRCVGHVGRRNTASSSSGSCAASQRIGALPFNNMGQWPPMGAYVASPIASDDEGYKRYVALPGERGLLRLRGNGWHPER